MITVHNLRTFRGDSRRAAMVDRTSPFGNPFSHLSYSLAQVRVPTRAQAIFDHRLWWYSPEQRALRARARAEIGRYDYLLCHCAPADCHGDTIADYLNFHHCLFVDDGRNEIELACRHGVAMDVHCCNCHRGFLFGDPTDCVCTEPFLRASCGRSH